MNHGHQQCLLATLEPSSRISRKELLISTRKREDKSEKHVTYKQSGPRVLAQGSLEKHENRGCCQRGQRMWVQTEEGARGNFQRSRKYRDWYSSIYTWGTGRERGAEFPSGSSFSKCPRWQAGLGEYWEPKIQSRFPTRILGIQLGPGCALAGGWSQ